MQWIEGERAAVRALYAHIRDDPRHADCEVIAEGPTEDLVGRDGRLFPGWDMHLVHLGELPVTLEGFLDVWLSLHASDAPGVA